MTTLGLLVNGLGFIVWAFVAYRAVKTQQDLTVLALVLVIMGFIAAAFLGTFGIEAPGAWSFLGAGVLLLALWPEGRSRR